MVNEFHTIDAECAVLVPQGPGYENIPLANKVCTTVGSVPGSSTVNGNNYIELSYSYTYGHLWRVSAVAPVALHVTHASLLELWCTLRFRCRLHHDSALPH